MQTERGPGHRLTAVDLSREALSELGTTLPEVHRVEHDLAEPLPFEAAGIDVVISHNVLECLLEPGQLLVEIARVLRSGGRAVLGHTDFETIVVTTADRDLSRRVLQT